MKKMDRENSIKEQKVLSYQKGNCITKCTHIRLEERICHSNKWKTYGECNGNRERAKACDNPQISRAIVLPIILFPAMLSKQSHHLTKHNNQLYVVTS